MPAQLDVLNPKIRTLMHQDTKMILGCTREMLPSNRFHSSHDLLHQMLEREGVN